MTYIVYDADGKEINRISAAPGITNDHQPSWFLAVYPGCTLEPVPDPPVEPPVEGEE